MRPSINTSMAMAVATPQAKTKSESEFSQTIGTEPKIHMNPPAGKISERLFLGPPSALIARADSPYPVSVNMASAQCMRITSPKTRQPIPVHMTTVPFYSMRIADVNEITYAILY